MPALMTTDEAEVLDNSSPANKLVQSGTRIKYLEDNKPFRYTATITSAAAATAVSLIPDADVPSGKKVYITDFHAKVNGGTLWATTATVKIQDTNSSPVEFVTMAVAALTANAFVGKTTANITIENAMSLGTGGTADKGLVLKGNANGTGSNLVVTVTGFFA